MYEPPKERGCCIRYSKNRSMHSLVCFQTSQRHVIYLGNRKHVPCFYRVIETRVKVWENEKCCGNTSRDRDAKKKINLFIVFQAGTVTNPTIWLVLSVVRIFLSLTTVTVSFFSVSFFRLRAWKKINKLSTGLVSVRIVKNCDLGLKMRHFQDLGHSFSLYGPPSPQITYIYFDHQNVHSLCSCHHYVNISR